jgi:hypothetical protein
MRVLIIFLLGAFFVGASTRTEWLRQRPLILLGITTVIAASYWTLKAAS